MRRIKIAAMVLLMLSWGVNIAAENSAATPDLNGVWMIEKNVRSLRTDSGELPPMTDWAREKYQQHLAARQNGKIDFDTTESLCASPGVPRIMTLPYPFEILQNASQVLFLFGWNFMYRWVPVDASGKSPEADYPTAMGVSAGHWEGSGFVIETTGRTEDTLLDAAGLPNSEELRVVERLTLVDRGRRLENRIRIEDPIAYRQPWETTVTYRKLSGVQIQEDVCVERIRKGKPAFELGVWIK